MVLFYGVLGLWGLFLGVRGMPVSGSYRGALILAQGLAVVQLIAGVALLFLGPPPRQDAHYLYGISAVLTLPLVHVFLAERIPPPLAYGLGTLFMFGLAIRGIVTA